ncbi:MAG: hypothetical protein NTY06_01245 [Candidatus Gottesmanbacteria bacterium]|nr:hypothetical protein [Candidatus Gottesmanbacteria bacterium]
MEPSVGVPPPPPMPKLSRSSTIITILIFITLFVAGILLSSYIRPFIAGVSRGLTTVPTPTIVVATPPPVDPFAGWKTLTVAGLSYKLPPDVLAPTCDGTGCVSQGTYLPGGTRLTIAPKTVTQSLTSLRGAVVTDSAGTAFTSHDATVSGHTAIEFTGTFAGRTSGGYGFTQMHGFMIEVTPTVTLEINHFTPAGVTADWVRDDALFTQIISTLSFTQEISIATATPVPATTSGY